MMQAAGRGTLRTRVLRVGAAALCLLFVLFLCPDILCANAAVAPAPGSSVGGSTSGGSSDGNSDSGGSDGSDASGSDSDASGSDASASVDEAAEAAAAAQAAIDALYTPEYEVAATAVCLMNEDTGMVIYEKNADAPLMAASLVKMMTCLLVVECAEKYGDDLDTTMIDSRSLAWVYDELTIYRRETGNEPSTADIRRGEVLSLRELLYAALLPSANEAAMILADYASVGYVNNFLYMMNTRAARLGCTGTYFADVNGLAEENVTTARDMALITQAFMARPELVAIAGEGRYQMEAHEGRDRSYFIHNTNRMLVQSSPYYNAVSSVAGAIKAGKTGSLGSWQNFASMASKNGDSYICVVLHSPATADAVGQKLDPVQARPALYESAQLYAWAFSNFSVRSALDTERPVTEIKVRYSTQQSTVMLMPSGDIKAILPNEANLEMLERRYDTPAQLDAPVQAGQVVGSVTLLVRGQELGSAVLTAARDVERNSTLYSLARVGDALTSTFVRVLLVQVVIVGLLYAGIIVLAHRRRQRQKQQVKAGGPVYRAVKPSESRKRPADAAVRDNTSRGGGRASASSKAGGNGQQKRPPAESREVGRRGEAGTNTAQPRTQRKPKPPGE